MDRNKNMKALVIEDDPEMAGLVMSLLRRRFSLDAEIAYDCASARRMMSMKEYDIITLDYRLPDGAGLDLLDEITEGLEHPPVIMVTGHGDEETAARSFQSRASGYVVKDSKLPATLTKAVEKALADISLKRVEREILDEKIFIEDAINSLPDIFMVLDIEGSLFRWNRALSHATGYSDTELASMSVIDLCSPGDADALAAAMERMKEESTPSRQTVRLVPRSGQERTYELSWRLLRTTDGFPLGFCATGREAVERSPSGQPSMWGSEQFRAVLDNSMDAIAVFDSRGTFIYANRASEVITGFSQNEWAGMDVFGLVHPDDLPIILEAHQSSVENPGRVTPVEVRFRHKQKGWRIVEAVGQGFVTPDGEAYVVVNARDITSRKQAEEDLREREQQLRMITDNMEDIIAYIDSEGVYRYVSPSFGTVLGYDLRDYVDTAAVEHMDLVHPDDLGPYLGALERSLASFKPERVSYRIKHKDGHFVWMESVGVPLLADDGSPLGIVVASRDVSERMMAEEAVRKSEEKYRRMFDLSPELAYLLDREGNIMDANEALVRRTGMSADELSRTNFMEFFAGDNLDELNSAIERLWSGEEVRGLEITADAGAGELTYEVNSTPIFEDGSVKYVLSLARDITERKRAEEEQRRLTSELEGFARTVSHDLKSPLTSIKLAGETLARVWDRRDQVADVGAEIHRLADVIGISTSQAEQLIRDLLALAVAGPEPEDITEVDVGETVGRLIEEKKALIEDRGAQVIVEGDLGRVSAHPTHVYQLFGNLIDNAIRHNHGPKPRVLVRYLGEGPGGHTYVVKDNGPGIPPDEIENVFLPFYKGENGFTGVGLAIVDKIVKLYGGSVRIYGDGGACFEFTLKDR